MNRVNVISLFDGMACGMLAMMEAGLEVERYVAYEIDKYAVQTSTHNFPVIEHRGDVFKADFTEFEGFDFLVGGSPCTYWSIAQKNNRETEASGMGWELFSQYVRALHEAKPKWFIYENNKSMSKAIRASIDEAFGFEAVGINSALVSAQNRQRLYWVGKRNEDGTYSKVDIEQPEDRGILLKDVLESGRAYRKKANCLCGNRGGTSLANDLTGSRHNYAAEPVAMRQVGRRINEHGHRDDYNESLEHIQRFEVNVDPQKTNCVSTVAKDNMVAEPVCLNSKSGRGGVDGLQPSLQDRIYSIEGKHTAVTTGFMPKIAEPVCLKPLSEREMEYMVRPDRSGRNHFDFGHWHDGNKDKSACITANTSKGVPYNVLCEPVCVAERGRYAEDGSIEQRFEAREDGKSVAEPVRVGTWPNNAKNQAHDSQQYRIYSAEGKSVTLCGNGGGMGAKTGLYAIPVEFDGDCPTKAVSVADGKTYTVYMVKDGQITIKGKTYPIKLEDGLYIIRKLTVRECMRLQTVPEWYEFPVSDTQAYKMLGNGWTVEVISHLLNGCAGC